MYCGKCGSLIEENSKFCGKCGTPIASKDVNNFIVNTPVQNNNIVQSSVAPKVPNNNNKSRTVLIAIIAGLSSFLIVMLLLFVVGSSKDYYFSEQEYEAKNTPSTPEVPKQEENSIIEENRRKHVTLVDNNKTYEMTLKNQDEGKKVLVEYSESQKSLCPKEILDIENELIRDYNIPAVNLCEIDPEFAKGFGDVFKLIYKEFPYARGYLTNFTLNNTTARENYIAAFMPMFVFITPADSSLPMYIKTQVLLNSKYFLNEPYLKKSMESSSLSGHFPPNSTKFSPIAHELGHYLSFLAMMKDSNVKNITFIDNSTKYNNLLKLFEDFRTGEYSLELINEAYEKAKKEKGITMSLDEWRGTISNYAVTKDDYGEYIYDETIAESFHDVFLNGDNASEASKYIYNVLKEKLK